MFKTLSRTKKITFTALFSALIAAGAFIRIPIPLLSFTLQNLFCFMAGLLLGGVLGCISVAIYIILGLIGLPIFTTGGGIGYVLYPSFGYLIGFFFAVLISGLFAEKSKLKPILKYFLAGAIYILTLYIVGLPYFYLISKFYLHNNITAYTIFISCFLMFIPTDILQCLIAAVIATKLRPILMKN